MPASLRGSSIARAAALDHQPPLLAYVVLVLLAAAVIIGQPWRRRHTAPATAGSAGATAGSARSTAASAGATAGSARSTAGLANAGPAAPTVAEAAAPAVLAPPARPERRVDPEGWRPAHPYRPGERWRNTEPEDTGRPAPSRWGPDAVPPAAPSETLPSTSPETAPAQAAPSAPAGATPPAATDASPATPDSRPQPARTAPHREEPWLREHATQAALVVTALAGIVARGLTRRGRGGRRR